MEPFLPSSEIETFGPSRVFVSVVVIQVVSKATILADGGIFGRRTVQIDVLDRMAQCHRSTPPTRDDPVRCRDLSHVPTNDPIPVSESAYRPSCVRCVPMARLSFAPWYPRTVSGSYGSKRMRSSSSSHVQQKERDVPVQFLIPMSWEICPQKAICWCDPSYHHRYRFRTSNVGLHVDT